MPFELAKAYAAEGMTAYVRLQQAEFAAEQQGYTATRISARWEPAISMRCPPSFLAVSPQRRRSPVRLKKSSFIDALAFG
jgi:hypothetical protein